MKREARLRSSCPVYGHSMNDKDIINAHTDTHRPNVLQYQIVIALETSLMRTLNDTRKHSFTGMTTDHIRAIRE